MEPTTLKHRAAAFSARVDRLSGATGSLLQWAALTSIGLAAFAAISRKLFGFYSNAWSEMQWYLFGAVFLLGAADVLRADEHVRVDALWVHWSNRTKAWIDLVVLSFVALPTCVTMVVLGALHTWSAYTHGEHSYMADGLLIWPVRALVPLGFLLLALQSVAEILRRWMRLWPAEPGSTAPPQRSHGAKHA
ncbi:MAG: TRAP transporter small permease subunit [Piscinibacter sp.]|nr:TRAP transporter small permease subunit [Piscinibacter sp.]